MNFHTSRTNRLTSRLLLFSLAWVPYSEVQQLLSSRCFQVLDGADSVQTLLKEELS